MIPISKEEVLGFLKSHHIMTLATVSEDGKPHSTVLLYVVDDDFSMYFASHTESHKVKNVAHNNFVSLTVWEHQKLSIQVNGEAELVSDAGEIDAILTRIVDAGAQEGDNFYPPILSIGGESYSLFKIKPSLVRGLDLSADQVKGVGMPFTDIAF
jgi:uncharacterized pyridoxamine 5'-phosphate oxidase family protein